MGTSTCTGGLVTACTVFDYKYWYDSCVVFILYELVLLLERASKQVVVHTSTALLLVASP